MAVRGTNIAGSFRLPQQNTGGRLQSVIDRGLQAEQELIGQNQAFVPAPPEELQYIQGITDEVYKKWADLKSFAQTMWNNYRVDVSRPDLRDENSIAAHQAYKKATADLMYSIDLLKNSQKQFSQDQALVSQGKGVFMQDPNAAPYASMSPDERFYSTDNLERAVQESNMYLAKPYDTVSARNEANTQIDKRRQYIESIRNKIQTAGGQQTLSDIGARLNKATYEQPQFRPDYSGKGSNDPKVAIDELNYLRTLLYNNDPNGISWLKNQKGIMDVQQLTGQGQDGVRIVTSSGKTYDVDFNSELGGLDVLNELRNNVLGSKQEITTRDLLPYLNANAGGNRLPDRGTGQQLNRFTEILVNMYNDDATNVDDDNREYVQAKLNEAVKTGTFTTQDGKKIVEVETKDDSGWFSDPETLVTLITEDGEELEYNLSDKNQLAEFTNLLRANGRTLIDWNKINKVQEADPKEIPVGPMPKGMSKEEFQKYLQKSGTFNVDEFIKSKSK
jgi:hypothetical protein